MDILEDVLIKVGDFYVLIDFMIPNTTEDACTQMILGRSFLVIEGYKIDFKEGLFEWFMQVCDLMMTIPPISGLECDMGVDIEIKCEGAPSNGEEEPQS